ncbi:hypothetical protein L195_g048689 [Trifolium pratense]|uniref:Uncharacterized protein n=1 Tax=Trifolium pratense TaxID=57577 RepID=A0A2K3JM24_TRIPR|nr:hypothetical protein L195_g048689 [Trifolium pratense]
MQDSKRSAVTQIWKLAFKVNKMKKGTVGINFTMKTFTVKVEIETNHMTRDSVTGGFELKQGIAILRMT